jgi:hypothetical protein
MLATCPIMPYLEMGLCDWRYLVGFVHAVSGRMFFHLASAVSIELFEVELAAIAEPTGAGRDKQIVLVLVRAGWHTKPKLRAPDHVHLLLLPPYLPELRWLSISGRTPHRVGQPTFRHEQGPGRCLVCPLPHTPTASRAHPFHHAVPLVA